MQSKKFYSEYLADIRTAKLCFASKNFSDILSLRSAIEKAGYRIRGARELDNDENIFILLANDIEQSAPSSVINLFSNKDHSIESLFCDEQSPIRKTKSVANILDSSDFAILHNGIELKLRTLSATIKSGIPDNIEGTDKIALFEDRGVTISSLKYSQKTGKISALIFAEFLKKSNIGRHNINLSIECRHLLNIIDRVAFEVEISSKQDSKGRHYFEAGPYFVSLCIIRILEEIKNNDLITNMKDDFK